jgi:hypothetical protein
VLGFVHKTKRDDQLQSAGSLPKASLGALYRPLILQMPLAFYTVYASKNITNLELPPPGQQLELKSVVIEGLTLEQSCILGKVQQFTSEVLQQILGHIKSGLWNRSRESWSWSRKEFWVQSESVKTYRCKILNR